MGTVTVTLSGDEARLLRALDRVISKERELARKAADTGTAAARGANKAGRAHKKMAKDVKRSSASVSNFGKDAVKDLKSMVTGAASVAFAVGGITAAFRKLNEERKRGVDAAKAASSALGSLVQLSGGDPKVLKQLTDVATRIRSQGGATSLDAALKLTFQLGSAGATGAADFFSRLQQIDDAASVATSASLLRKASAGKAGTFRQIASKGIAGAGFAPGVSPSTLLEGAARAAATGAKFGVGADEIIAATSLVAEVTGKGKESGSRVKALIQGLAKSGRIGGKGQRGPSALKRAIRGIVESGITDRALLAGPEKGGLGSIEAFEALAIISQGQEGRKKLQAGTGITAFSARIPFIGDEGKIRAKVPEAKPLSVSRVSGGEFEKRVAAVRTAGAIDLAGRELDVAARDPLLSALRRREAAAGRKEVAELRRFAVTGLDVEATLDVQAARSVEAGEDPIQRLARQAGGEAGAFTTGTVTGTEVGSALGDVAGLTFGFAKLVVKLTELIDVLRGKQAPQTSDPADEN